MTTLNKLPIMIFEGQWDDNISWEFYLSDELPDPQLCSAVYCLAIHESNPEKIVLARNGRGWEMLGGHLDPGETIEEALVREAIEEGGFYPVWYRPFGFRKIIAKVPVANDHHGGTYPQVAFIPHFIATTDRSLVVPTGEEIFESAMFSPDRLPSLEPSQEVIIRAGLLRFRAVDKNLELK